MSWKRLDKEWVSDEAGAKYWLPDMTGLEGFAKGIEPMGPGGPMDSGAPDRGPETVLEAFPEIGVNYSSAVLPPDLSDPTQQLMPPLSPDAPQLGPPDAVSGDAPIVPTATYQAPQVGTPVQASAARPGHIGAAPGSVAQAEADVTSGFNSSVDAGQAAVKAQHDAAVAEQQRVVAANEEALKERDKTAADNEVMYQQAIEKADNETADWLKENEKIASTRIDRSRAWTEKSRFQKGAYWISVIAAAFANPMDASKNIAIKMLADEIEADASDQKDTIGRRMDASRTKGEMLRGNQARDMAHLKDTVAERWQRWETVKQTAEQRAKLPGSEALQAGFAQVAAHAEQEKLKLLESRAQTARASAAAEAERKHEEWKLKKQLAVQWAQNEETKRHHKVGEQQAADKMVFDYLEGTARAGAAGAAAGGKPGDTYTLPSQTGFRVGVPGVSERDIVVPKERADKVDAVSNQFTDLSTALQNMRSALVNSDGTSRLFNTDAERISAIAKAVAPIAKQLNGGAGAQSEGDAVRGALGLMGFDHNSFLSKIKGPDLESQLRFIDKQIEAIPANAGQKMMIAAGLKLAPGEQMLFTPPSNLGLKDKKKQSADDVASDLGVTQKPRPQPTTIEGVKAGREAGTTAALPEDLAKAVRIGSVQKFSEKHTPGTARESINAAHRRADDWYRENHAKPGAKDFYLSAKAQLHEVAQQSGTSGKYDEVVERAVQEVLVSAGLDGLKDAAETGRSPKITHAQARAGALKAVGMDMTTDELDEFVREVNARVSAATGGKR